MSRNGIYLEPDESFYAWTSGNLDDMIKAAETKTNAIDRHMLLHSIVKESYKKRDDEEYRNICIKYSELHIKELSETLMIELNKEFNGVLPRVKTFQYYSTLLSEVGEFDKAIEVCELAITFGLNDGTKSGFQGRINRIRNKIYNK